MKNTEEFDPRLTEREAYLGLSYIPTHIFLIPTLLGFLGGYFPQMTTGTLNLIYYGLGLAFLGTGMMGYLRRQYDELWDHMARGLLAVPSAYLLNLVLSYAVTYGLMLLTGGTASESPNDALLMATTGRDYNILKALGLYIGPLLEEVLFRGVLFGILRTRSRVGAYVTSVLLFSVYHVWQYALAYMDLRVLLYAVQYFPVSIALCWCYEKGGTLWSPIFLHMLVNALGFAVMPYLA